MATYEQIAELRRLINEPDNVNPWTDPVLASRIDSSTSVNSLASTIWREKAASFASLIDVKEGNSDRKMSQYYKQALEMASSFDTPAVVVPPRRRSNTRRIERQ